MCSPAARAVDAEITLTLALSQRPHADAAWDALPDAARGARLTFVTRARTHRGRARRAAHIATNLTAAARPKAVAPAR